MNFVTGGTGMLGAHLIGELLRRQIPVIAGCRNMDSTSETLHLLKFQGFSDDQLSSIEWRICDVLNTDTLLQAFEGCERVFHTAAVVSYHSKDRELMYETNVAGTANVVNAALHLGNIKLIHVSSIAALGKAAPGDILNENSEWKNSTLNTHYGITKHMSDLEVWRGVQEGLSALIVHPGFIIGAGSFERSSPSVYKKIDQGLDFYPPGGTGFIGAKDCALVMIDLAMTSTTNENVVLVSHSESMQWLFQKVAESIQKRPPRRLASKFLMYCARIAEWIKELITGNKALVTRETVKNASIQFYYDNKKLRSAFPNMEWNIEGEILEAGRYFKLRHSH